MIALLLDQGLAPGAAEILRQRGIDVTHVLEVGLDRAEDADILAMARLQNRAVVTLDHDFHSHLAVAGQGRPSDILLRIEGLDAKAQADLIEALCTSCGSSIAEGAAVSADGRTVRIRRLPLR